MSDDTATSSNDSGKQRLEALKREHRELDAKIKDITSHPYLSPEDQIEVASLKKLKLKKKDQILRLSSELGIEA